MADRFHSKKFSESTKIKLNLFKNYTREWLPVFLNSKKFKKIRIFDLFAGPGCDPEGNPGSPKILIDEVKNYIYSPTIKTENTDVELYFNELNPDKFEKLKELKRYSDENIKITFSNCDFVEVLPKLLQLISEKDSANLVIIDQYGVKHVSEKIFKQIINTPTTDLLFFISSSYIKRFIDRKEFSQYFPSLIAEEVKQINNKEIHKYICEKYYNSLAQEYSFNELYLSPFSLRKGANIHGIIFCTKNLRGLDKFLEVAWREDTFNGEANYLFDGDIVPEETAQLYLLPEPKRLRKLELFKTELLYFIKDQEPDNLQTYIYTLTKGFRPSHGRKILTGLKNDKKILCLDINNQEKNARSTYITWDNYKTRKPKAIFRAVK